MVRPFSIPVLVVVTALLYVNSFPGSFHYDDVPLLLENPVVTGENFPFEAFVGQLWGRPLTLFTFHWNYQLSGSSPAWFHFVNCCLHVLVVVLLYAVLRRYTGRSRLAFAAAVVFAMHPIQSQAVNYVWSRSELLMAAGSLLSLLFCRRYSLLCLLCFQFAIWSRAEALVLLLPLVLLCPERWKSFSLLSGVNMALLAGHFYLSPTDQVAWTHSDPVSFWLAAPLAFWKYVRLMVWPSGHSVDHPLPAGSTYTCLLAFALMAALVIAAVLWRKRCPLLAAGVAWVLLFMAPSLLIPNSDLVNESRSYLAFAGFVLILASLIELGGVMLNRTAATLFRRWTGEAFSGGGFGLRWERVSRVNCGYWPLLLLVSISYVPLTLARNQIWQDEVKLWEEAVRQAPEELRPRYNLGVALSRADERKRACEVLAEALELSPRDGLTHAALGYCAELAGAEQDALRFYRAALRLDPDNEYARLRMSLIESDNLEEVVKR